MVESGRVIAVEAGAVWVETIRQSACGSCSAQKGCGQGLLNKLGERRNHLRVLLGDSSPDLFQLNDEVRFSVPEHVLLKGAAVVYLLPLLGMMTGLVLGQALAGTDAMAFAGAVTGFAAALGLVRVHAWIIRNNPDYQPVVVPGDSHTIMPAFELN